MDRCTVDIDKILENAKKMRSGWLVLHGTGKNHWYRWAEPSSVCGHAYRRFDRVPTQRSDGRPDDCRHCVRERRKQETD